MDNMQKITFAARSDTGRVRTNNEDNLYIDGVFLTPETRDKPFSLVGEADLPCVFAVCDGMGGQADGEFASLTAAGTLARFAGRLMTAPQPQLAAVAAEYVAAANGLLCDEMRKRAVRMGTTLALAVARADGIFAYSLGDSRIYALADGKLRQLSRDHTLAQTKIAAGLLTEEEARLGGDWHKLTACIGLFADEQEVVPDVIPALPAGRAARILICSDGLTDMVRDDRIEEILRSGGTAAGAADALLAEAIANGGRDNTTVVVFDVPGAQSTAPPGGSGAPKVRRFSFGSFALGLALGLAAATVIALAVLKPGGSDPAAATPTPEPSAVQTTAEPEPSAVPSDEPTAEPSAADTGGETE
ncbi:MAG: protein phosphatase 2C domain-containing protein [Oscillospiraceae bacterium]|jgi:protein phosphatase|nr:protein phosphatase 2C domain-containing protein [Oscillospiraceae bacterium]